LAGFYLLKGKKLKSRWMHWGSIDAIRAFLYNSSLSPRGKPADVPFHHLAINNQFH
jgi:hypothetical protein